MLEIYVQPAAKIGNQHDTLNFTSEISGGFDLSNNVLFYVCTKLMKINHNAYKSENYVHLENFQTA